MVGCWVTWWRLLDSIVGSVGLHGKSVRLHGRVLGYMVGSGELHDGDCWITLKSFINEDDIEWALLAELEVPKWQCVYASLTCY